MVVSRMICCKNKIVMKALFSLIASVLPLAALAHDGHGYFAGHTPEHFFSSPVHLLPAAFAVVMLGVLVWRRVKAR